MSNVYFTDREIGPRPRIQDEIQLEAWGGIVSIINTLIMKGSFGSAFPDTCPDGGAIVGTNERLLVLAVKAEIPDLVQLKKEPSVWGDDGETELIRIDYWPLRPSLKPSTNTILDIIGFCYRHAAEANQLDWHSYYRHHHLTFDQKNGQSEFRKNINIVFSRNGLAYELREDGHIIRIPPSPLDNLLKVAQFKTGDSELDSMLTTACNKYLTPDIELRRESLEKLWDAWERIKTVLSGKNKKSSAEKLLEKASQEDNFRRMLETEALELTRIGNEFQIRHSETNKIPVKTNEHIDYLFHRLFAIINLFLVVLKK